MPEGVCRDCGKEFVKPVGSPGYVNQCLDCEKDVEKVCGRLVGGEKEAGVFELVSKKVVKASRATKFGLSVGMVTPPPSGKVVRKIVTKGRVRLYSTEE